MPEAPAFCQWLQQTYVGASVRESLWLFPAIETVHLLGMAVLIVTITVFDLRLLGLVLRREPVSPLGRRLLPWTWGAFAIQVITGSILYSSEAVKLYNNPAFRLKLLLILFVGLQALIFHWTAYRNVERWDQRLEVPVAAKVAGCLSLFLWVGIVTAGRFIGFV
jgi:hypothetical protein